MNSVTFARSSRTDPNENDYGWSDAPPPRSSAGSASDARPADASDELGQVAGPSSPAIPPDAGSCDPSLATHDIDACPHETIADGVLFYQQQGDPDAIDAQDVAQRAIGDCYAFASIAALSQTADGRDLLRHAITENKNDHGDISGWTVTLHQPESHLLGSTTFREVHVTVDTSFVVGHAKPRLVGPSENAQKEIWPLVLEKALATYLGGYNALNRGGDPSDVMALLTGREANAISLQGPANLVQPYGAHEIASDLAAGKLVVLETRQDFSDDNVGALALSHGLYASHAYFAIEVQHHGGEAFLKLGNPWGLRQPEAIPCAELARWFSRADVGSTH